MPGAPGEIGPEGPDIQQEGQLDQGDIQAIIEARDSLNAQKRKDENQLMTRLSRVKRAIASLQAGGDDMEAAATCLAFVVGYRDYVNALAGYQKKFDDIVGTANVDLKVDTNVGADVEAGVYDANYCLGKALYNENIFSGASRPLVRVLQRGAGPDRPYFKDAFYMLEEVSAKIGYRPPVLAEITAANLSSFNQPFRDDFNYYFGKFFFDSGVMGKARDLLSKVSQGSEDYPEARYLEGVAVLGTVNNTDNNDDDLRAVAGDALTAFQDAILAAESERGGNEEILQLGYLALARTWYELGFYNVALFYYQKLPPSSSRNADAKLEQAWTYFLKNDFKKALGLFHMLGSPYYEKWFFPDLDLLEATVYLNLCQFKKSKVSLAQLDDNYLSKQPALQEFLTTMQAKDPAESWSTLVNYYDDGDAQRAALPRMFADAVLDDLAFFNTYKQIQALQIERDALRTNVSALGEFGQEVFNQVEDRLRLKVEEGGLLVLEKLSEIDRELTQLELNSTAIEFDIEKEEKEILQARLQDPDYVKPETAGGATLLVVADDWHPWPFEGEYWLDEVDNYRSTLRTRCVEQ